MVGRLCAMAPVQLHSPLARAVVPVLAGIGFFAVLGLVLWGIAALMAGEQEATTTFTPDRLEVGDVQRWAGSIDADGPIIFAGLGTTRGERTLVLDHDGDDPERGWRVYYAHPADRGPGCPVEQVEGTDDFVDCEGRTLDVTQLAPPTNGEFPVVEDRTRLYIDLGELSGPSSPSG